MSTKSKELNFEKALAELEQIVNQLDRGNLTLNESLALFEKGIKLTRFLRAELDRAEKKIEILLKNEKGEMEVRDFNPEEYTASALEAEEEAEEEEEDEEEEE